jgi:serine protease Do
VLTADTSRPSYRHLRRCLLGGSLLCLAVCNQEEGPIAPERRDAHVESQESAGVGAAVSPPGEETRQVRGRRSRHPGVTPRVAVPDVAEELAEAFADAARAIHASVVRIDVELAAPPPWPSSGRSTAGPDFRDYYDRLFDDFGPQGRPAATPGATRWPRSTGSGFVLDRDGHILTNSRVVERARSVAVTLPHGEQLTAAVVGRDPVTDLAVVKLQRPPRDLIVARTGDAGRLRVGQWVLAVGSPRGLRHSVAAGIVSGLGQTGGRTRMSGERVRRYIQTDATIDANNAGGPLVTLAGEVVGVITFVEDGAAGTNDYAVPISEAVVIAATLIKEGRVRYPYIGVEVGAVGDFTDARQDAAVRAPAEGALVTAVVPGSPSEHAGLREGDVILTIDAKPTRDAAALVAAVWGRGIGATLALEYWREGRSYSARVPVRELPTEEKPSDAVRPRAGLGLQTLTEPIARSLGLAGDVKDGAVVTEVQAGGPAGLAGLRPGDVIVEIDRQPVRAASEGARLLKQGGKREHLLRVVSGSGARFVTVTPE